MDLQKLQSQFALINLTAFAKQYDLSHDHLWRVLKGKRVLTEKYYDELQIVLQKFKESL